MQTSLYELSAKYQQAYLTISDTDLPEDCIKDTLESMEGDIQTKAIDVAKFIKMLRADSKAINDAIRVMGDRSKAKDKTAYRLELYLLENLKACGINKVESPYFDISVRKNPPAVVIDASESIPADYWTQPVAPDPCVDKKLIAQAIKDGYTVPGAHLESGTRLDIK